MERMQNSELVGVLEDFTDELLWMSETDAPFEVFHWEGLGNLTEQQLLERTQHALDTTVEVVPFDDFFAASIEDQDWFEAEEKAVTARYRSLVHTLKQHLSDLRVYRVGEVNLDLYIVGRMDKEGIIGLATQAVET